LCIFLMYSHLQSHSDRSVTSLRSLCLCISRTADSWHHHFGAHREGFSLKSLPSSSHILIFPLFRHFRYFVAFFCIYTPRFATDRLLAHIDDLSEQFPTRIVNFQPHNRVLVRYRHFRRFSILCFDLAIVFTSTSPALPPTAF